MGSGTWCQFRPAIHQRFPLEHQKGGRGASRELEPPTRNRRRRLWGLVHQQGFYFHATALWQPGGILGNLLGTLTSPSRMSSGNTFRLDSWWMEKRRLDERLTARVGSLQGRISMRRDTTAHRSSLSLWGMPWAISLPTMSPTIHHLPRNGGAKLFRSITSM